VATKSLKDSGANGFDIRFAEFRHRLTESIRSHFRESAGVVAAAFVTGETRAISATVNDDMRIAGLYHLLAVSGMNLSVVAGIAFFSLRFLLATVPALALRYDIKKWAALLALAASYIYQLSFSATAALIASYEWGVKRFGRAEGNEGVGIRRVVLYFAAVMATASVAWLATEPFIIYHFNQFSSYSLIANTIAELLVSFILMPLVITGVLLEPLHLGWIAFTLMQYGVDLLLAIARTISHLPHAMLIVPAPTDAGFACAMIGALWIYYWHGRWRWFGVFAVAAGMSTALLYEQPNMFISAGGKHVAVRLDDGNTVMIRGKATSVNAQSWACAAPVSELEEKDNSPARCDGKGCILHTHGHDIAVLRETDAVTEECALSNV
jgi:competence protein ComEC